MLLVKPFSTSAAASVRWRTEIEKKKLASQVSSVLLQRHNWVPLLKSLGLSHKLNQPLFLKILRRTKKNPKVSLEFFDWVKSSLGFQPDLRSHCLTVHIALRSGTVRPVRQLVESMVQKHAASVIVDSIFDVCDVTDSHSLTLSFFMECFSKKGLSAEGLYMYKNMRVHGFTASIGACNALLDSLRSCQEFRSAWCLCGAMIRNGILPDGATWSLVAQILYQEGKFERIARILDAGISSTEICNLLMEYYCKSGDFRAAFDLLNKMCDRKLKPGFNTFSFILDGASKHRDKQVIDKVVKIMVEKELLPQSFSCSENNELIRKLCELGKTYAAEMFFERACDDNVVLEDATYGRMLEAFSAKGRRKEAVGIYKLVSEKGIKVSDRSYHAFANILSKEDRATESCEMLSDMIIRGFIPCLSELSRFIQLQCSNGRWQEAEDLMNVVLEKGLPLDTICCSLLISRYCFGGRIDAAIQMHDKMENLNVTLDVRTYNVLLNRLFVSGRKEEAFKVFDYMRRQSVLSSESYVILIKRLFHEKELRKAMELHDEMLKVGLKPDKATYKRLISGFK